MKPGILLMGAVLLLGSGMSFAADTPVWPTQGWRRSTPEAEGLDSDALAEAFDFIRAKRIPIHNLSIERNGALILDAYFFPFADNQVHDLASDTKSVTSTLIGMAIGAKAIAGLDAPILSLFPEEAVHDGDPRKAAVTIGDLLSMNSGLDCHADHGEITLGQMRQTPHWAQFMLDLPMVYAPGTHFEYCSGGMHVLSAALSKATGQSAFRFATTALFAPLGIAGAEWPADGDGVSYGWGDLHLQPRDMLKLGYLWLNNGRWGDDQIIPADYLRAATGVHSVEQPSGQQYGYGFWVYPDRKPPLYEANGRGGQRITVIPTANMVVVTTGGGFEPADVGAFILKALKSDTALPANPAGNRRLAKAIADAAIPPAATITAPLPPWAGLISNKVYRLDDNPFGMKSITLTFKSADVASVRLTFSKGRADEDDAIGLDGVPRLTKTASGRPVALLGRWEKGGSSGKGEFAFEYDQVSDINAVTLRLSPEKKNVSIHATQRAETGSLDITFLGRR